MIKNVAFLSLLALLFISTVSKAIVANKVIIALNCGSKEDTVDAYDKIFKYQPVIVEGFRMRNM